MVLSASWIALTGRYPMAFDEDFHLGLIRLYASHGLPFWSGQPAHADVYGAVARDPSYLFHYLMSFPYRLISLFSQNEAVQVLVLRAINIALFVSSLPLFRRVLLRAGASSALANGCLAVFVLTPISPQLAAQINYDNLLLPLTALILLVALKVNKLEATGKLRAILQILVLGLAGSLIKFAFLPIFLAVLLWLVIRLKAWRLRPGAVLDLRPALKTSKNLVLVFCLLLLSVLAIERYGINVIRYHDPIPNCGQVLSLEHCKNYGPYIRDNNFAAAKPDVNSNPLAYTRHWFYAMWFRSFFAVDGPKTEYQTRGPFVIPAISAVVLIVFGCLALIVRFRCIWRTFPDSIGLFGLVTAVYVSALWLQEFKEFLHTGVPVAINGRYLLLVLAPISFILATAVGNLLRRYAVAKTGLLLVTLLCLISAGGGLTYILRSNNAWYWPNPYTRSANHAVQRILGPVTPGFDKPTAFLHY